MFEGVLLSDIVGVGVCVPVEVAVLEGVIVRVLDAETVVLGV